ncbi:MAG: glutaminase [Prochlorococcaceae cyanobacterium]
MGDSKKPFTIRSCSNLFMNGLDPGRLGMELMAIKIDVAPCGKAFEALTLQRKSGEPRKPIINTGAISAGQVLLDAHQVALQHKLSWADILIAEAVIRSAYSLGTAQFFKPLATPPTDPAAPAAAAGTPF